MKELNTRNERRWNETQHNLVLRNLGSQAKPLNWAEEENLYADNKV